MRSLDNTEPLSICLLSYRSHPYCGGQGVYVNHLSRALKALGHQVDVISGPPAPKLDEKIDLFQLTGLDLYNPADPFRMPSLKELKDPVNFMEWLGVSTMGFPEPFTFGIRAHRFLKKRTYQYDIVHDNQSISYGIRSINRFIPTIATIHHPMTVDRDLAVKTASSFWAKIKLLRWYSFIGMQKRVARTLSHIITVSKSSMHDIGRDFNIPLKRFKVIPNGIDTDLFHPIPEIKREKNRIIVTSSSETPLKGLHYLLEALAEISKTRKIKLVVVGTLRKNGDIERLLTKLGINGCVTFTGHIENDVFVQHYAKAFLTIVPSVYEGFGFPAGEAMACGLPVISTTGGALPEVVGNAGILVPPANSKALVKAILSLMDNTEQAKQMGRVGFNRVRDLFTWKRAAEMTVEAYRETIHDYHRL
ncbi:MAG: glycosyltransferase family 4 protein [Deltaproteobacteria bacterium]|jgi:glycosyltransferase involved in cell wall biosynthesis|nr:glycosyltransferase family 4 protein [Deltaproteobacteria bacterium]